MPIKRERLCWWCGKKLAAVSHATVAAPDGLAYIVHKWKPEPVTPALPVKERA